MLALLLQESQFWPLPGLAQPANDSAYVSMYLFVSLREFMCVLFYEKCSLLCAYLIMNSIQVAHSSTWPLVLYLDDQ